MALYNPVEASKPIKSGKVQFTITDWLETESAKGEDMVTVTFDLEDSDGATKVLRDHFLLSDKMVWKLGLLAKSIGQYEQYLTGVFEEDHAVGLSGFCKIERVKNTQKNAKTDKIISITEYLES